jgi:hypothetical protein
MTDEIKVPARVEGRMILENQAVIMDALIALASGQRHNGAVVNELYYHAAKTKAYLGPRR